LFKSLLIIFNSGFAGRCGAPAMGNVRCVVGDWLSFG
jgi:hypothetical protein